MKILYSFVDREPFFSVAILLHTRDYFKSCTFQFELKFMSSNDQQQKTPSKVPSFFSPLTLFATRIRSDDRKEKGFTRERRKNWGSERRLGYQPINQANRSRLRLLLRSPLLDGSHQASGCQDRVRFSHNSSFRKDPPTCEQGEETIKIEIMNEIETSGSPGLQQGQ